MPPVKLIFTPKLARQLLHLGHQIIDVKPNKFDRSQTVFVFKDSNKIKEDMKKIL